MITASTRTFAVLGDPVRHSLSPVIHNAAFAAAEVDAVYVALRCASSRVPGLMHALAVAGGGGNITVPHKIVAAQALDVPTQAVVATGACNTFWGSDGKLFGDNTDVEGFARSLEALHVPISGARVLVLGAGGAAAAALYALQRDGAGRILVRNRNPARAAALLKRLPDSDNIRLAHDDDLRGAFDIVVNATPLGLHADDPPPLDLSTPERVDVVVDMVYAPSDTAWVVDARRRGLVATDGKEMLLGQGAAAFERWLRTAAPMEAMRSALARVTELERTAERDRTGR